MTVHDEDEVQADAAAGAAGREPAPSRRVAGGRWWSAVVVVGLLLLVPTVGLRMLLNRPSAFCTSVSELPALSTSLDADGSPGPALVRYADLLDAAASAAPTSESAAAARTLADHERALGALVAGSSTGADVVGGVAKLDDADPDALATARDRLDDAIATSCP